MLKQILKDIVSLSAQAVAFRMTVGAGKENIAVILQPMRQPPSGLDDEEDGERPTIGITAKSEIEARRIGF